MKQIKVSGLVDGAVFVLFLGVVRWCHWQDPLMKTLQYLFLGWGFLYYITEFVKIRKVQK